jgi:hypothetical protein
MLNFVPPKTAPTQKFESFLAKHRREALDLGVLGASFLVVGLFIARVPALAVVYAGILAGLYPLPNAGAKRSRLAMATVGTLRIAAIVATTGALLKFVLVSPLKPVWFGAFWVLLPLAPVILLLVSKIWSAAVLVILGGIKRREVMRCLLLAGGTLFLMRGFASRSLNGGDDALWYATMLADMVAQVRSGVFPVWVGQSVFQFNGAIYPLRVAPAFHYLGALLDFLTLHRLGIFALQNLLLTLLALCATASAYLCLRKLLPKREWLAAGLAALFVSCPGVLGIAYNQDLYMSWTTVAVLPPIWLATVRSFQPRHKVESLAVLGAALGLCWWGHSPIALWSTLLAFGAQVARLFHERRGGISWKPILTGAGVFGLIAGYPIGSVLFFPPEAGASADSFQKATAGTIVYFLNQAFPSTFCPVSDKARSLGDFQLGYSLWAILLLSIWSCRNRRPWACVVALVAAVFLSIILLPIPGIDSAVWTAIPAFVRDTTGNWVMNRLYLPLAAAIVFGAAACASEGLMNGVRTRRVLLAVVAMGSLWSLREGSKFANLEKSFSRGADSAADLLRPENIQMTRFSYLVFGKVPSTFTHGVADPNIENHIISRGSFGPISTNAGSALMQGRTVSKSDFPVRYRAGEGYIEIEKPFRIEEGHSYLLKFDFTHPEISGVLQINGPHFSRVYALPEHGGAKAFGAGAEHSSTISVWTTAGAEDLTLRFVPIPALPARAPLPSLGHVSLLEYDPNVLPVRVDSWIPYKAHVESPTSALLETPRMYQRGYSASVDQAAVPVEKSPDGFVCVPVPKGESTVELRYLAPVGLQLLFWVSILAILGAAATGMATSLWVVRPPLES